MNQQLQRRVRRCTPVDLPIDPGPTISATTAGNPLRNTFQIDKWPGQNYDADRRSSSIPSRTRSRTSSCAARVGANSIFASGSYLRQGGAIRYLSGFAAHYRLVSTRAASRTRGTFDFTTRVRSRLQGRLSGRGWWRGVLPPHPYSADRQPERARLVRAYSTSVRTSAGRRLAELQSAVRAAELRAGHEHESASSAVTRRRGVRRAGLSLDFNFSYDGDCGERDLLSGQGISYDDRAGGCRRRLGSLEQARRGAAAVQREHQSRAHARLRRPTSTRARASAICSIAPITTISVSAVAGSPWSAFRTERHRRRRRRVRRRSRWHVVDSVGAWRRITSPRKISTGRIVTYSDGLVRRDASSLFGSGHRWATFGRGSLAWRVSQEPWWFIHALDELKLRASVGSAGNRPPFDAQYETYSLTSGALSGSATQIGNKNLRPETRHREGVRYRRRGFHKVGLNLTWSGSDARDQILIVPLRDVLRCAEPVPECRYAAWNVVRSIDEHSVDHASELHVLDALHVRPCEVGHHEAQRSAVHFRRRPRSPRTSCSSPVRARCTARSTAVSSSRNATIFRAPRLASCGPGKDFQANNDGYIVYVGQGNTPGTASTKNLWQSSLPEVERVLCVRRPRSA